MWPSHSGRVLAQSRIWSRAGLRQSQEQMSTRAIPGINEIIAWLPRHRTAGELGIEVRADSENVLRAVTATTLRERP